jgi:hypothetical protein
MSDLVQEFAIFLFKVSMVYLVVRAVILYFSIKALKAEFDEHIQRRLIPVTVEFDKDQYYCYNKQSREFMAQGSTYDEIKKQLQARFSDCVIYIDDGDPEVVDRLLGQK